jgi:hypothetical protein
VCDAAGNFAQATDSIGLDTVKPVISISHTADGDNGWNVLDPVTEDISASDATSGVASVDCSDDASGLSAVYGFEPTFGANVSGEGFHNLSCAAADYANNTSVLDTDTVKVDTVAPTVMISTTDDLAGSGWYNIASSGTDGVLVVVATDDTQGVTSLSCTDNGVDVGALTLTGDSFVIDDGSHLIECAVSDDAGNDGNDSESFDVDQTAPSIVTDPSANSCSLPGLAGWCRGTQTAGFSASDGTSGITAPPCVSAGGSPCDFTKFTTTNGSAVLIASGSVSDVAGNTASSINSAPFKIDSVVPTVTVSPTRPSPDFGIWYNASLPFDTTGSDATSGVSDANCSANYTWTTAIDGDGMGLTRGGTCTDNAGNAGTGTSAAFNFDDTNPSVTVTPDRVPDHNLWYNANVTFDTNGTDLTSNIGPCTADQVYSGPDGTGLTVSGSCSDNAGNTAGATSGTFKFDNTNPVTTITFPTAGGDYTALTWNAGCGTAFVGDICGQTSDNLSGRESIKYSLQRMSDLKYWNGSAFISSSEVLLSPSGLATWMQGFSYSSFPATGFYTVRAPATDLAGNVNSGAPATFKVNNPSALYGWEGFFQPIDNTLLNTANAGQTIPVKWRITLGGVAVSDPNSFVALTSRLVPCNDLAALATDDIETYSTNSGLLYLGNGNWHFNWQTPKSYANQCRVMTLTLNDGSTHDADFKFK